MTINKNIRQIVLPLIAAIIWGCAFVFQKEATNAHIPAFAYNSLRALVAAVFLAPIVVLFNRIETKTENPPKPNIKLLIIGGICCGIFLTAATNFQQLGIEGTTAGKSSFITALYIVLVPIVGIFFKKKAPFTVWISVIIALVGLYFLCINVNFKDTGGGISGFFKAIAESMSITKYEIYLIICAVLFTFHILSVSYFSPKVNPIALSCIQFLVVGIVSGIISLCTEAVDFAQIKNCISSILYVGILSSGVAYTLQIIAEKGTNPTIVSLLLSLESVFGVLSGAIVLQEKLLTREYIGCALMLFAVVLAQIEPKTKKA